MISDKLEEAAKGFVEARNKGLVESTKDSLQGWRDLGGMDVGLAVLIDLVFLAIGYGAWSSGGLVQWVGAALVFMGAFGILEKIARRVI